MKDIFFDLDGTLVDSMPLSTAADKRRIYLEMLEKEGMQPIQEVVGIRAFPGRRPQGDSYRERHAGSVPDSGCCRTFRPF